MELTLLSILIASLLSLSSSSSISECEVNFEYMDYKVITRRCKGPAFPAEECCTAFKEFACPYVNEINDMNSDCAQIMFSYLNIYGNYPPGVFANECKEKKDGLVCPLPPLSSPNHNASPAGSNAPRLISLLISAGTSVLVS